MLRAYIIFVIVVATSSAPTPYYSSLIETPTSRVQQYFFMGPRPEAFKAQPHETFPQAHFSLPLQPSVYYYHQPQPQNVYHTQEPLNLYGMRQNTPFWEQFWNQITGQGSESSAETGESPQEGNEAQEENSSEESLKGHVVNAEDESIAPTSNLLKNDEESTPETESVNLKNQLEDQLENTYKNSFEDIKKNPNLDCDHETTSTTLKSLIDFETMTEKIAPMNEPEATLDLTTSVPLETSVILDNIQVTNDNKYQESKKMKTPMHRLFYTIDDQYYVLSGSPQFYGNIDPRSLMFSLQELQPIMRNDEKDNNNDAQEQKITSLPISSPDPTSTFKINVVDEDEGAEKRKETDNNESVKISARSQLPSDDQSSMKMEKEETSRKGEKQDQTAAEGESVEQ